MTNPGEGSINVILQAAVKSTQKVHISKHIAEHIPEKNRINVHGKDVRGGLPGRMNLPDISVNIPEPNRSNARTANDLFQDLIICHCT